VTRDRDTQGVSEVALQVHIVDAANDHGRYPQALGLAKGLGSDEPSAHDNRAGARLIDHLGYEHGVRGVHEHADGPVHLAPHADDALDEGGGGLDHHALLWPDLDYGPVDVGGYLDRQRPLTDEDLACDLRDRLDRAVARCADLALEKAKE